MTTVPIRYRRTERGLFAQKLQHALPSLVVLGDGITHLSHNPAGAELVLGLFEVGAALAVMASVVRGFRKLRRQSAHADPHPHHGPDWIDIFIGVMLAVEAYAKYHATHHIPRPTILLSVTMLAAGMMHGKLASWADRRRQLRVSDDGISVPVRPFSRFSLSWAEVASIDIGDRYATITAIDGRKRRLDLSDMIHAQAVRGALMQATTFLDAARHAASASIESTTTAS